MSWKERALHAEHNHEVESRNSEMYWELLTLVLQLNPSLEKHRRNTIAHFTPQGSLISKDRVWDLEGMRKAAAYEDTLAAYEKHGPGVQDAHTDTMTDLRGSIGNVTVTRGPISNNLNGPTSDA